MEELRDTETLPAKAGIVAPKIGTRARIVWMVALALLGGIWGWSIAPTALDGMFVSVSTALRPEPKSDADSDPIRTRKPIKDGTRLDTTPVAIDRHYPGSKNLLNLLPFALLGAMIGAYAGFQLLNLYDRLVNRWDDMDQTDKVVTIGGTVIGIVVSFPFILFLQALGLSNVILPWCYLVVMVGTVTVSIYLVNQISEILPTNRGKGPVKRTGIKLLDTSVIIDGRVYDVIKKGFLEGQLYIPRFVLEELQLVADHHDAGKRQRGKRGLEILKKLQAEFPIDATGSRDHFASDTNEPVDSRLVRLARAIGADLVTNDHNLNRVASLQDIRVLNINDLSLAVRANILPHERLRIAIIREGNQSGQGVGYLDDGTMVVVENGRPFVGQTHDITVTQVIQTERGKMIFGEIEEDDHGRKSAAGQRR